MLRAITKCFRHAGLHPGQRRLLEGTHEEDPHFAQLAARLQPGGMPCVLLDAYRILTEDERLQTHDTSTRTSLMRFLDPILI